MTIEAILHKLTLYTTLIVVAMLAIQAYVLGILLPISPLLVLLLLPNLIVHFTKQGRFSNYLLPILSFNLCYLFAECIALFAVGIGLMNSPYTYTSLEIGVPVIPYFRQPAAEFHPIRGYQWKPGAQTAAKQVYGTTVFNNTFTPNPQGFLSPQSYTRKKPPQTYRFITLGDSFTDAYYLKTPWPTQFQALLNQNESDSIHYQCYSFALNGGGISNWNSTFWEEIVPRYEFDALIIPCFANDLARPKFIMHHTSDTAYLSWDCPPVASHHQFEQECLPIMDALPAVLDQNEWATIVSKEKAQAQSFLPLFIYIYNTLRHRSALKRQLPQLNKLFHTYVDPFPENHPPTWQGFIDKYGNERAQELKGILDYCKAEQKRLIFCSVPESYGIGLTHTGKETQVQSEMAYLAQLYGGWHFDGYKAFTDVPTDSISHYFLPHDGHWNQKGSDVFVQTLAEKWRENQATNSPK